MKKTDIINDVKSNWIKNFQWFISLVLIVSTLHVEAATESGTVTGVVTDEKGETIPGVSVIIKGTTNGTVTDLEGKYSLDVQDLDNSILVFSFVGMKSTEALVSGLSVLNIKMETDLTTLEEIVVVGYGTQKKSDVTGAVVSLPKERLQQIPFNNFTQAIQGTMPGVSITNRSGGAEQGDSRILIRGRNSIKADNGPLIVLDGVPYSGSYSDISPSTIASIEVLKDASSAAIYGSRGANGVILITTKGGQEGVATITYDGNYGIQKISNLPNMMNGKEFHAFKTLRSPDEFTTTEDEMNAAGEQTDWLDLATRNGSSQQHTLSIGGGSEATKYFLSGSILDVKGIAVNDNYQRITSRVNLDTKINDWLTIGTRTQFALSDRSGLEASFEDSFIGNPLTRPYDADGNLSIYPNGDEDNLGNPLQRTLASDKDKSFSIFTNNYLNITIPWVEGLSYRLNTGYELKNDNRGQYYGRGTKAGLETDGRAKSYNRNSTSVLVENILNYNKSIDKHTIGFTGLYSFQEKELEEHQLNSQGYPNDVLTWYAPGVASSLTPAADYKKETLLSLMGRLNYSFDNKYLVTLTARRDGFSGFGSDTKWGTFPSVALGWNLHNESFIESIGVISNLKLRMSYGKNGNQAVSAYETIARVNSQRAILDSDGDDYSITNSYVKGSQSIAGYYPSKLGQSNLGWETTTSTDIGLDFGILEGRIQGSFDYYISNTTDLLLDRAISSVHGITSITQNIGEVKNSGFELMLNATVIKTDDLSWNTMITFSNNKNEIVDLYGNGTDDIINGWFIGQPISSNYDYVFDGVWQEGDDFTSQPDALPGYAKVLDTGEVGITDEDRALQGHTDPNINWGLMNTLTYKNFTFNFFFQGVQGATRANALQRDDMVWIGTRRNTMNKNWWTAGNKTNEHWSADEQANSAYGVDIYESTDFVRLKDVTLSYDLPVSVLESAGISRLKLSVSGRNLMTFTDWTGLDPEMTNQFSVPLQKEINFSIALGL